MIIKSIHGTFSIQVSENDHDKLIVKSNDKGSLTRIFDGKRINHCSSEDNTFYVSLCKQEFAHALILMVKEVDYVNFDQTLRDITSDSDRIFA